MGKADYLLLGDWNTLCSMCGFKFKASQLSKNWQGQYRCNRCQEARHPQDFVRAVPDVQTPPWVQPAPDPLFAVGGLLCTEASDLSTFDPMDFICTETLYPLSTES